MQEFSESLSTRYVHVYRVRTVRTRVPELLRVRVVRVHHGTLCTRVRWICTTHPVRVVDAHKDFNPRKVSVKGDRTIPGIRPLKGWLLGNVPPEQIMSITQVSGVPETTIPVPYDMLRDTAEAAAFTADLILHTSTMQSKHTREPPQQTNQ